MSAGSLTTWLSDLASRDALIAAWRRAPNDPLLDYETGVLAAAARSCRTRTPITISMPGGRSRLPLLTAVHAAALQLSGFPSPLASREVGPVALVTSQVVRRAELTALDAAGVPVSPALHAARLRADQLVAPLPAGRPTQQTASQRLLLVSAFSRWVPPAISPTVAVIDATDEPPRFTVDAVAWAQACGAIPVLFADIARQQWLDSSVTYPCGWSHILGCCADTGTGVAALARVRGHAAVVASGAVPGLSDAVVFLAAARRRGQLPPALIEASTLWRRLDELVVPVVTYDAACPRWHTPTLSERIEDLLAVRAEDFPRGWRTWAQTGWAGIKEGIAAASRSLSEHNAKAAMLAEAVDADLRAGLAVDIALPSRVARDALSWHLAEVGVPLTSDGGLVVRSLADVGAWEPPRATLLSAPPGRVLRHRITGADLGPLNVLCYDHEVAHLRRLLLDLLDEPEEAGGPVQRLLPPALRMAFTMPVLRPAVVLSTAPAVLGPTVHSDVTLAHLADAADMASLAALNTPEQEHVPDLPDESEIPLGFGPDDRQAPPRLAVALQLTVSSSTGGPLTVVHVPADGTVARILAGVIRRIPSRDLQPGMLLVGLDGLTPFDRLRPLLPEARGSVTRILLAAWDQALTVSLQRVGGPASLANALSQGRNRISVSAVATWANEDRIGPREPANVTGVGVLAGHPLVIGHGHAIAIAMKRLRQLHQSIGRLVASAGSLDTEAAEELAGLLGPDALSILAETVIYRLVAIGEITKVPYSTLYGASPCRTSP
jgi:hypothetical protein